MNPVNGFCPKIWAPFCEILISFCFCHAKAYCCRADFPIVPVGAATCRPPKTQGVFPIFFRTTSGMQSRRSRVTSFLVTIIFGSQIDLIAAVGCTSGRMEGDRREAVVEDSSIAQAIYNPCQRHPNFKRLTVNFGFITYGRTFGARTPLAFKNSPPFDKRTVPLSSKRGTAYG